MTSSHRATPTISVVPANEVSWADLETVFGDRGDPARCRCQYFRVPRDEWRSLSVPERSERLREQTHCEEPDAESTSGLVAFRDGEPVGWCAVEPRTTYRRLMTARVPWAGRAEDKSDDTVWSVTCFVTRSGFRRQGVSTALAAATVDFASHRGATAVEGYPMITLPGQQVSWGELFVGSRKIFVEAGFREVSRPTPRRAVMRIDFPL